MLKALIFDVDGTLAETEELHRFAFNRTFAEHGLDWSWDRDVYRALLDVSGGKERIRHYVETRGASIPGEPGHFVGGLHARKTAIYTELIADGGVELRPGVRQVIETAAANGVRLAIATTTSRSNVCALLHSAFGNDADGLFEAICAGDCVPAKKPAPDVYVEALRRLSLSAEDCLAIEDSRNGLLAAHAAGIPTIVTPGIYTDDQDFAEALAVLPDLGDPRVAALLAAGAEDLRRPARG